MIGALLLAFLSTAGARSDGMAALRAVPLPGPASVLGNPASLGLGNTEYAAFVDGSLTGSPSLRMVVAQGRATTRGPAGLVYGRDETEEGERREFVEISLVLPDVPGVAYGVDLRHHWQGDATGWNFDFNLAVAAGSRLRVGAIFENLGEDADSIFPPRTQVGLSWIETTGGIIGLEFDDVAWLDAAGYRVGLEVPAGDALVLRGGLARSGGRSTWTAGFGTSRNVNLVFDGSAMHEADGWRYRVSAGMRLR